MACQSTTPYWSVDSDRYHTCKNCTVGNNIEKNKFQSGWHYGNRTECDRCKKIKAGYSVDKSEPATVRKTSLTAATSGRPKLSYSVATLARQLRP